MRRTVQSIATVAALSAACGLATPANAPGRAPLQA